jgi:NAD(P)-dependent dehydrogenase (short-subunit alcohol dehydrogenase family)
MRDSSGSSSLARYQGFRRGLCAFARGGAFDESDGVRLTTIAPGVLDTPILENRPEPPDAEMRTQR